ncbi:hypothetical protein ACHHYP_05996, partial [Achlya hypogyna]
MKVFPYGRQLSLTLPLLLLKAERGRAQALGSIIGGTANEGDTMSFVCPSGEVIGEVLFASFGTPTGTLPNYAVGWCAAAPSEDIVESLCLGSNSCQVPVNIKVFGDPCYGTDKYLHAAVQCVDENVIGGSASEDSVLRLHCPPDRMIGDVTFASFGTPTGPFLNFATGSCDEPTSAATVATLCAGQPTCEIVASTSVFGDPCPGEDKFLSVQVDCINANAIEGTVLEGSVLHLTCPSGSSIQSVDFASYGTPKNYVEGACHAPISSTIVTESCVGHSSCQVAASNDVFGDPCPTKTKILSVQAQCTPSLPPGFIQASASEGDSVLLACPAGKTISNVPFASFGTPTGYESPSWCDASSSIDVVASECVGKSFCSVAATTGVFGDPCPGTAKRLNVAAQCSDANWVGGSVNEGSTLTLTCPANQKLAAIQYASFGTPLGDYPNFVSTWCNANTTVAAATAACVGHASCSLDATSGTFGDPCPGLAKHLSVIAECADANLIGGAAPEGGSVSLACPAGQYIGSVPFASYGTPSGSYPDFAENPACDATGASNVIESQCLGANNCTIAATSGGFGDPCPGTKKTLGVTAKCVPENVIGTRVKEGDFAALQCPPGSYIASIDMASFGTPQGSFPDFSIDPACHTTNSTSVVSAACYGQTACTVPATTTVFTDSCTAPNKSLAVVAECISNDIVGATALEGSDLKLTCPAGKTVQTIDFASFGTPTGHVGAFAASACDADGAVSTVQQACLGKHSCSVPANSGVFSDPCYGTQKHLAVQATCATPPPDPQIIGGSVPEHSSLNLTCPEGQTVDAILFASYGTATGVFPSYNAGWCNSPYSTNVASFLCLGQSSCLIKAESAVFSDPCYANDKTLSVVAHCATSPSGVVTPPNTEPTVVSADASDGDTLSLQCPGDFVVGPVLFASYGTSAVQFGSNTISWCHAPLSSQAVKDACVGKNACSI